MKLQIFDKLDLIDSHTLHAGTGDGHISKVVAVSLGCCAAVFLATLAAALVFWRRRGRGFSSSSHKAAASGEVQLIPPRPRSVRWRCICLTARGS